MNQTTTTATETRTHPVTDLEALRLQLEDEGKDYSDNENSEEPRDQLLGTLQTNDCREIITALVDRDDLANAFVVAGGRGHVDLLEAILDHGMNIDIKDKDGWTALMYASCNDDKQCLQFLLDCYAKVDVQTEKGYTALMYASQRGFTKIVEMLLAKNANPDFQNIIGMTASMLASSCGHKEIVQLLLNHNADIELKNNDGKTALDLAKNETIKNMFRNHVPTSYVLK